MPKRVFKINEFVAHTAPVNCVQIGRKSGQVLATGGEDKLVNLWKVGSASSILSLPGHKSGVTSVGFDSREEVVVAGSAGGSIKLFDLTEAKVARSLRGHRSSCLSVDFHPMGEVVASGSQDTTVKVWDLRRKRCIMTYRGHTGDVCQLKFSPDGRWVVSGDDKGVVKLWDLTAGKLIHQFTGHTGEITGLAFHHDVLVLASSSADRTVKFWDMEAFEMASSTHPDLTRVRALCYTPDGDHMLTATQEALRVWRWEGVSTVDTCDVGWSSVSDMVVCGPRGIDLDMPTSEQQLLAVSTREGALTMWGADMATLKPFGGREPSPRKGGGDPSPLAAPTHASPAARRGRRNVREPAGPSRSPLHSPSPVARDSGNGRGSGDQSPGGSHRRRRRSSLGPLNPHFAPAAEDTPQHVRTQSGVTWTVVDAGAEEAKAAEAAVSPVRGGSDGGAEEKVGPLEIPRAGRMGVEEGKWEATGEAKASEGAAEGGARPGRGLQRTRAAVATVTHASPADAGRTSPASSAPPREELPPTRRTRRLQEVDDVPTHPPRAPEQWRSEGKAEEGQELSPTARRPRSSTAVRPASSSRRRGGGEARVHPAEGGQWGEGRKGEGVRTSPLHVPEADGPDEDAGPRAAAAPHHPRPARAIGAGRADDTLRVEAHLAETGDAGARPGRQLPRTPPRHEPKVVLAPAGASAPYDADEATVLARRPAPGGRGPRVPDLAAALPAAAYGEDAGRASKVTKASEADKAAAAAAGAGVGGAEGTVKRPPTRVSPSRRRGPLSQRAYTSGSAEDSIGADEAYAPNRRAGPGVRLVPSVRDTPALLDIDSFVPVRVRRRERPADGRTLRQALMQDQTSFQSVMQGRLRSLNQLRSQWEDGDVHATLERLRDSREPSLLVDFLRSVDLSGKGINLSCCAELLPLLARMLDSHFEEYVVTALNSVKTLFELFSLAILQTRKLHERGGPVQKDIVWEERVENAAAAFDALLSMRPRVQRAAMKAGLVGRGAGELRRRLDAFFSEADS